jgi:hypothetical protein
MQTASLRTAAAGALAAALLAAAGAAAPARAQGLVSLGIAAGATVPTSSTGDGQETGFHATLALGSQPPLLPIGFRAEATYNQFTAKNDGVFTSFFPNADLRVVSVTGNVLLSPPSMLARPYVIGGLGYYNVAFKDSPLDTEGKFGFNAGVGAKFALTGFSTYAEVRYHRVNRDGGNIAYIPVTFGIMF